MNPFPIILSAPSGGGKTTIARQLLQRRDDLGYSVSCTTRSPRNSEVHGTDYYFLSLTEFIAQREKQAFAEAAVVHGNLYGTLKVEVKRVLSAGRHVIMDIDVQGAKQFKRAFPDSVTIFVLPPSGEVLLERLRARQTEDRQQLISRLQSALLELQAIDDYEYVVVNDDLEQAIRTVSSIVDAEVVSRNRVAGMRHSVAAIIGKLEREISNQES
ncbi:MAG: guanylate kinase [Gemmatimonadaceae bacterium]|nr:guanylate kinase [Gemmatimonadaceae bacterium]